SGASGGPAKETIKSVEQEISHKLWKPGLVRSGDRDRLCRTISHFGQYDPPIFRPLLWWRIRFMKLVRDSVDSHCEDAPGLKILGSDLHVASYWPAEIGIIIEPQNCWHIPKIQIREHDTRFPRYDRDALEWHIELRAFGIPFLLFDRNHVPNPKQ